MALPVRRMADISAILLRYGFKELNALFGQPSEELRGTEALNARHGRVLTANSKNRPARLRKTLEELGPTFIKLGQVLSTRPDLIHPIYADEFRKLQDQVPPFDFEEVQRTIREEFGKSTEELFTEFSTKPVASASLSQVHRAVLSDGRVVAVKIQRPDIQKKIKQDIRLLKKIAALLEKRSADSVVLPSEIVSAFEEAITQELDFEHEAETLQQFSALYKNHPLIFIPQSVSRLSSPRIVTMDFIDGIKISDQASLTRAGFDKHLLARRGLDIVMSQIFESRMFHGDPHPGNIFVISDGRLAYVDFGLTGTLSNDHKLGMLKLLIAVIYRDADRAVDALADLDIQGDQSDADRIKPQLDALFKKYGDRTLEQIRFRDLTNEIIKIMREHRMRLPRDLILLVKAIATSETVGVMLDPQFEIFTEMQPVLERIFGEETNPKAFLGKLGKLARTNISFLEKTPETFHKTLDQLNKGKATINLKHEGLDKLEKAVDVGSNQIAYGLMIAALIIGGASVAGLEGPRVFGLHTIAFILFVGALILTIVLVGSISYERKR